MLIVLAIVGALFFYALIYKPEIIAVLFFTITIADINFEIPGVPVNFRALVGVLLFARTVVPEKYKKPYSFFGNSDVIFIIIFLIYTVVVTQIYELITPEFSKSVALTFISIYTGYYYFMKAGDTRYLKISLIIASLICFADLVYTYAVYSEFPVQRIYLDYILHVPIEYDDRGIALEIINHNFYGLVDGMCFVFLLNDFINKKNSNKFILLLLPVMFLGVLMSTSRSSLLGIIAVSFFLISRELRDRRRAKKAFKLISIAVVTLCISLFLFTAAQSYLKLSGEFIERISGRLIDEPVAVFNKHLGLRYNAQSLEALEWRGEASSNAFEAYMYLTFPEQLFGIGFWGFVVRDLGHNNLPPHNGMLLLLIENGLVGLIMYILLVFDVIRRSLKANNVISPMITVLLFVIFYCIGQNGELTSSITFLFVVTLIAETDFLKMHGTETDENISYSQ